MGEAEEQVGGPFAGPAQDGSTGPAAPLPADAPRRRRWPRRLALVAALTPPLLWGTREWTVHPALIALAPWAAEQVGASLELEGLESDWWSSLQVDGLRFAGGSLAPVAEAVEVEAARLRWDMGRLVRGEVGWLQQVELVRPRVTLDLTSPSPDGASEGPPAELPAVLPDLRLVGGGLTLRLPNEQVEVMGLGLAAAQGADGWRVTGGPERVTRRVDGPTPAEPAGAPPLPSHSLWLDASWTGQALELAELRLDEEPLLGASSLIPDANGMEFELRLLGPLRRARATGSLQGGRLHAAVEASGLDLARLGARLEGWLPEDLQGDLDLDLVAHLELEAPLAGEATVRLLGRGLRYGEWTVDDLELRGSLADGRVRVDELDLRAPDNRVRAEALDLDLAATSLEELLATAAGTLEVEGTDLGVLRGAAVPLPEHAYDLAVRLADGAGRVERGLLRCAGGSASLRGGNLAWTPTRGVALDLEAAVAFEDLAPLAQVLGLEGTWAGSVEGQVAVGGTLEDWTVQANARGEGVVTSGMALGRVRLVGDATRDRYGLELLELEHPDGTARITGAWRPESATLEGVQVAVHTPHPARWASIFTEAGSVALDASLDGPWSAPSGEVLLAGEGLALPDLPLRTLELRGTLDAGVLSAEAVRIATDRLDLTGALTVALPLGDRDLDLALDALELSADGAPQLALVAPARVRRDGEAWTVEQLALEGPAGAAVLDLRHGPEGPRLHAETRALDPMPLARAWREVPFEAAGLDLSLDLAGTGEDLVLSARGRAARLRSLPDGPLLHADLEATASAGTLRVSALEVRQGTSTVADLRGLLALPGAVGWETAPLQLGGTLHWPGSGPVPLGDDLLTGPVDGVLELAGSWSALEGRVALDAPVIAVAGTGPLTRLGGALGADARLAFADGALRVETLDLRLGDQLGVRASGTVLEGGRLTPWLAGEGTLDALGLGLEATLTSADLSWLERLDLGLRRTGGGFTASVAVGGTAAAPELTGIAQVRGGMLRAGGAPPVEELDLDLLLEAKELTLAQLTASVGSAPLSARGRYDLSAGALSLTLRGQNLLLARDAQLRLRADADLTVEGTLEALRASGTLGLRSSRYLGAVDLLGALDGTPTFESQLTGIHIAPFPEGPLANMELDLGVTTLEPLEVRTNVLQTDATLDLHLGGTGAGILPEGSVFLSNGSLRLPSGQMDLVAGRLQFTRGKPFYPELQVQGESRLLGHDVSMRVLGDISEPRVELSSIPSLPPDQLLMLVVTGTLPASAGAAKAVEALTVYVAQDFLARWLSDPGDASSIADRLKLETGRDVSESGLLTLEARFLAADAVFLERDHLWIVAERDEYEDYNAGLRFSLDLR